MRQTLAASAIALMAGNAALADPWSVLIIGNDNDAIALSGQLSASGVADVRHLLDGSSRDIVDAVAGLAGSERALVYYNGALVQRGGQPAIGDDPRLTMAALADTLATGGARQAAILIENCGAEGQGAAIAPPVGALRTDVLLAASAGPGEACSGPVLSQALTAASLDTPISQVVSASWVGATPRGTFSLSPGTGAQPAKAVFLESRPEGTSVGFDPVGNEVQTALFVAPPLSQIAAIPVRAGFPQPSIIVGIIQVEPEATAVAAIVGATEAEPLGDIGEITYDNLEARVAFRESDPETFASLVEAGVLDPPASEMALAIQTELQRMNCYRSALDGDFGRGSRRGVTEYYAQRGLGTPPSTDPTAELFRILILAEGVECPSPVAQQAAPRTTSSGSARTTSSSSTRTQPAPTPAPAPAPAPQSSGSGRTIQSGGGGIGVFR